MCAWLWLDANPEPAPLEQIPYDDYPEIRINEHERTEMPFRYVKDAHGQSIMPAVSVVLRLQRLAWLVLTGWLGDDGPDQEGRGQGGGRPVLALCLSVFLSLSIHLLFSLYSSFSSSSILAPIGQLSCNNTVTIPIPVIP